MHSMHNKYYYYTDIFLLKLMDLAWRILFVLIISNNNNNNNNALVRLSMVSDFPTLYVTLPKVYSVLLKIYMSLKISQKLYSVIFRKA